MRLKVLIKFKLYSTQGEGVWERCDSRGKVGSGKTGRTGRRTVGGQVGG